jgi:short-subunit dehydrogenase
MRRKTVVITGASSGIGRATAEEFARTGARLILAARDIDKLSEVAEHCRTLGGDALAVSTDVADIDQVQALARQAQEFAGKIDVWLSNVGVGMVSQYWNAPMHAHEQVLRANLLGHMHDAYAVLPIFVQQGHGIFVNMISLGGFAAAPYAAAYSASKFGLRGFTEALRGELRRHPNVHVCDVYPAFVDSPGMLHAANYTGKAIKVPPMAIDPRRVARAIVKLSENPRATTIIGASVHAIRLFHALTPTLGSQLMGAFVHWYLKRAKTAPITDGNLFKSPAGTEIYGHRHAAKRIVAFGVAGTAALGLAALFLQRRQVAARFRP